MNCEDCDDPGLVNNDEIKAISRNTNICTLDVFPIKKSNREVN